MTVSSSATSVSRTFDGATTAFPLGAGLQFLAAADLIVSFITASGDETVMTLGDDYAVSGDGRAGTGTITILVAKQTGYSTFRVDRETEIKQDVAFLAGTAAPAEAQEKQHDRVVMALQERKTETAALEAKSVLAADGAGFTLSDDVDDLLRTETLAELRTLFKGDTGAPGSGNVIGFTPEDFDAAGDGTTNDHLALGALAAAVNDAGGGVIDFTPGATYLVGLQLPGNLAPWGYYLTPPPLLEFVDCAERIVIRGNGAKIKCKSGLKYGTFNPVTGLALNPTLPFNDVSKIATPYLWMLKFENCTGGIEVDGLELDGNIENQIIGYGYDNQGTQIMMTGIGVYGDHGPIRITNVKTHHHGLDGWLLDGPDAELPTEGGIFDNVVSRNNGRQGLSLVGGGDYVFNNCKFTDTGYDLGTLTYSPPGAGVDIEAEGGKKIRRVVFKDCLFAENIGVGLLAAEGDSAHVTTIRGTVSGDHSWTLWPFKPYYRFIDVEIVGVMVNVYNGTAGDPNSAVTFENCTLTNEPARALSGATYSPSAGSIIISGGGGIFRGGQMIHGLPANATQGSLDGGRFEDYTIRAKAGGFTNFGRYAGKCQFIEDGGSIVGYPGALASGGLNDTGEAEDPFITRIAGVTTTRLSTREQSFALSDAATITPDFNFRRNFHVTLAGNRTLANPTNMKAGHRGRIRITQDAAGSRTLAYGTAWKFPGGAPTLTTAANAVDVISYLVHDATRIEATIAKAFS